MSHRMNLGTIKGNLDIYLFLKTVNDDLLLYQINVEKSANEVQLLFHNAMLHNPAGDRLHISGQALLEYFNPVLM